MRHGTRATAPITPASSSLPQTTHFSRVDRDGTSSRTIQFTHPSTAAAPICRVLDTCEARVMLLDTHPFTRLLGGVETHRLSSILPFLLAEL